ncbi:MAG: N-acetyltransferase [Bauldia sp.]|uniref:GNAT family N-acetyltransferase n=1 Tax=Bauldia sp. TaxID=2575872 RepID=UPI001DAB10EF|nr:N-acetyltransferase [Bauldia sp.]MCB1497688.1 N-acetyltransferase [Bauldia sp.]
MIHIDDETPADAGGRELLLDRVMPNRRTKPSERLREGRMPATGLAFVARDGGMIVGSVRLWHVMAGDRPALLLGPLAVESHLRGKGVGASLMQVALNRAELAGHAAVILVGDPEYYARFGFVADPASGLHMPGPVERRRFLANELVAGSLARAEGRVEAHGPDVRAWDLRAAA